MRKEPLITRIILWSIIIIPVIILLIRDSKYKDLGYDMGEFTGYTLEIKRCITNVPGLDDEIINSYRYKQMYSIKENDYISESLGKNLKKWENTIEMALDDRKNSINSSNCTILEVKQLNENDVTVNILRSDAYKEISLKYGEEYKFGVNDSSYKIKIKKVKK